MIKLINGTEVDYNEDFDKFFHNLLESIIVESKKSAAIKKHSPEENRPVRDIFLQEIMDNSIYVTHQLFNIYKDNEKLTKFIITGFIFNSVVLALPGEQELYKSENPGDDEPDTVH